mmetsp:Transcript_10262/g.25184  ORF Transcript_10262/g.25184 Transcript_10262/m.25184 type:complete len:214 (-) Transcript_10262:1406-2047(-)
MGTWLPPMPSFCTRVRPRRDRGTGRSIARCPQRPERSSTWKSTTASKRTSRKRMPLPQPQAQGGCPSSCRGPRRPLQSSRERTCSREERTKAQHSAVPAGSCSCSSTSSTWLLAQDRCTTQLPSSSRAMAVPRPMQVHLRMRVETAPAWSSDLPVPRCAPPPPGSSGRSSPTASSLCTNLPQPPREARRQRRRRRETISPRRRGGRARRLRTC